MRLRSAALLALVASGSVVSCASSKEPVTVGVVPTILDPSDLFSKVSKITLKVFDTAGGVDCVAQTGVVSGADMASSLATIDLNSTGCTAQYRYCGTLTIPESDADRVFQAVGIAGDGSTVATGCARAKVNQSALPLQITMERYVPPANCGNGTVEATEQCEGMSFYCDNACHSTEVLLSTGSSGNNTSTGKAGDKFDPMFLWPAQSGTSGRFLTFFTDRASGTNDIGMRVLSDAWTLPSTPPAAATGELLLPNGSGFPSSPAPGAQGSAHGAFLGGKYYVVFQDDDSPMGIDIHLRSMDSSFVADQGVSMSVVINGTGGEPNIQSSPDIAAGPGNKLFIAWQDDNAMGVINGRTFTPPSTLGSQVKISTGTSNTKVALAATPTGWIAVWQSGDDVKMRLIGADGTPAGNEVVVNDNTAGVQDHPSVAALADGRFAVVFADHNANGSDIVIQRFNTAGAKVAGDQTARVNNVLVDGDQILPRVAGLGAATGSFAVTWLDSTSSHVRARFAGGATGYLPNNVDGQDQEFQASLTDGKTRTNPVVVGGGAAGAVIIGWEDKSSARAGIVGRFFPAPSAQ